MRVNDGLRWDSLVPFFSVRFSEFWNQSSPVALREDNVMNVKQYLSFQSHSFYSHTPGIQVRGARRRDSIRGRRSGLAQGPQNAPDTFLYLITRLRQLQTLSRTKHEHAVFIGVLRWRAIRSSSRKASARPVSPRFMEPKSNVMRRLSNGAGQTGSNVLGAMAQITASSRAARGVYSSVTRVASRPLSKRERSSLRASCRCASGSRRSTWSRNQRRAFPVSNSVDALASPRRPLG